MACIDISGNLLDISTNEQFLPVNESKTATLVDNLANGSYDVTSLYNSLKEKGIIPTMPSRTNVDATTLHGYLKADAAMRKSMEAGYKYYNARYKCAVERYIAAEVKPATTTMQVLSNRLFVLLSLYRSIDGTAAPSGITDAMNALNSQKNLLEKMSRGNADEKEMYMRMIEHTREKANVTNNLMQLYGFLNIVALGMIFYIYRST